MVGILFDTLNYHNELDFAQRSGKADLPFTLVETQRNILQGAENTLGHFFYYNELNMRFAKVC